MRLLSVTAKSWFDKGDSIHSFSKIGLGAVKIKLDVDNDLIDKLYFVFLGKGSTPPDGTVVKVAFELENLEHSLSRGIIDGKEMVMLSIRHSEKTTKISGNQQKIISYLNKRLGNIEEFLKNNFITDELLNDFFHSFSVRYFSEMDKVLELAEEVEHETQQINLRMGKAISQIRKLADKDISPTTKTDIDQISEELLQTQTNLQDAQTQLNRLREENPRLLGGDEIFAELDATNEKLKQLHNQKEDFDNKRNEIALYEKVAKLKGKEERLSKLAEEIDLLDIAIAKANKEILWQENELDDIEKQMAFKQQQYDQATKQRGEMMLIKASLERAAEYKLDSTEQSEALEKLNSELEELIDRRAELKTELNKLEEKIGSAQNSVGTFSIPHDAINATADIVKLEAKMAEIELLAEKLNLELFASRQQIEKKQKLSEELTAKFNAVLAADSSAMPIKAKVVIEKIIDAKISRLETINSALVEKESNLRNSLEALKGQEKAVIDSNQILQKSALQCGAELAQAGKNIKLLGSLGNTTKQDAETLKALVEIEQSSTARLEEIRGGLADRNYDHKQVSMRISSVMGSLSEIIRNIEINNAEIFSLQQEKNAIARKYNDLLLANPTESASTYLRAIEADGGTQYLLELQRDVVKTETELSRDMLALESAKEHLTELSQRWKELDNRKARLKGEIDTAEEMVNNTNLRMSSQLGEIHSMLQSAYSRHANLESAIKSLDDNIHQHRESILMMKQTLSSYEKDIADADYKSKYFIDGDASQIFVQAERMIKDADDTRVMLIDSRIEINKAIINKKVALESLMFQRSNKLREKESIEQEIVFAYGQEADFADVSDILLQAGKMEQLKEEVGEYDDTLAVCNQRIKHLNEMLNPIEFSEEDEKKTQLMESLKAQCVDLQAQVVQLENKRNDMLNSYLESNKTKLKLATASSQVESMKGLQEVLHQTNVVTLVLNDKINSYVRLVSKNLHTLTQNEFGLKWDGNRMQVVAQEDKSVVDVSAINATNKTLVYLACLSAVPIVENANENSIVIGKIEGLDVVELTKSCRRLKTLEFVTKVVKSQALQAQITE